MTYEYACDLDELEDSLPLGVEVNDVEVAIVKHGDDFFAILDECSHGKVRLSEGDVEDETIECWLHGSRFDLRTGRAINLPATQPVPVYPCRIEGTTLEVDLDNPITQH